MAFVKGSQCAIVDAMITDVPGIGKVGSGCLYAPRCHGVFRENAILWLLRDDRSFIRIGRKHQHRQYQYEAKDNRQSFHSNPSEVVSIFEWLIAFSLSDRLRLRTGVCRIPDKTAGRILLRPASNRNLRRRCTWRLLARRRRQTDSGHSLWIQDAARALAYRSSRRIFLCFGCRRRDTARRHRLRRRFFVCRLLPEPPPSGNCRTD